MRYNVEIRPDYIMKVDTLWSRTTDQSGRHLNPKGYIMKIRTFLSGIASGLTGPGLPMPIRKATKWITAPVWYITNRFDAMRSSRVIDRYRYVTFGAACKRDWAADPVMVPTIRANRKSGVGTPRPLTVKDRETGKITNANPFFPIHAEKNVVARVYAALAICNDCPMLRECRILTEELRPTGHAIVQGGAVYVEKITDFRALITKWNKSAPRALRIPTKGLGAWIIRRQMTPNQYDEYITNLSTSPDARAAALSVEGGILDSYETDEAWAAAVAKHLD